ncbi:hypothetical protein LWC34_04005 [Kibdelosporangium philippinense]|uniref:Uncharacterized protein n=1 Tax=Kibdelosporangium philippinense TaxID=211113 RepID=A0ABS8Z232_9PSEU|nr:hypothetical protein [Kibdelosporangium philippinense]MCE7001999.1 hypothetical protein [Kibdelosporangium philippinense]
MNIDTALKETMSVVGAVRAALVDYESGMSLGTRGRRDWLHLEVAAAGNTEVVRSKLRVMSTLGLNNGIEDVLGHPAPPVLPDRLLQPAKGTSTRFLFLVLDGKRERERERANLALARHQLKRIEADLVV